MSVSQPRIVALLPMRAQSERVPRKNVRNLSGKPLYRYALEMLLSVDAVAQVVIDTDSEEIAAEAPKLSPRVVVIERPVHLRAGDTPMNEVLLHDIACTHADWYVQTHSTNPLLRKETVERALVQLLHSAEHDSLFSVTALKTRLWWPDGAAINHDPNVLLRTQDLDAVFEENSNLYIFQPKTLVERKNRIGHRPMLFEIARDESWDIDDELDFTIAESLMERRLKGDEKNAK